MKNIKNIFTLLVVALAGLSLTACSNDDLDTNQYQGDVSLNVYGPSPVMRGGQLRFLGSNLDQIREVIIPDGISITNIDVVKAGVPSEIRVTVPKEGPVPGFVTLITNTDQKIVTKTELNYIEGIEITSMTKSAMPGDVIKIQGEYLNLIYSLAFADNVIISEQDFVSHDRYTIEVKVPDNAKTGNIELYTADLTVIDVTKVEYQTIISEEAIEIGVPSISSLKGRNTAEALGNITAKAGEKITISGSYFNVAEDVTVGGVSVADMTMAEDGTSLVFTLPAEAPSGDIMIICKSGVEVPVGTLTTIKPTEGVAAPNPVKAGQALTVSGKDMDVVTAVTFPIKDEGTVDGGEITVTADKVIIKAVPATAIDGDLALVMANGETVEVPFSLVKPTVTGYNSSSVSAGGVLTIQGTDLDLVKTVQFGDGSDVVEVKDATSDAITLTVPMNAASGAPTLTLANGTTIENVPEIAVQEAVFCYATQLPSEEDELKAGNSMTITVANGDKLTGVQMNGTDCQWILTGEDKNQLIIGIPEDAKAKSVLRLISSNGEISYDIAVIPASSVNKTIWSGLKEITWNDGGRVMLPAAAFDGVPAGAILTVAYSQKDQVWAQAQFNYGNWSGINFDGDAEECVKFNQTLVPTDVYGWFSDGILNRETSVVLTQTILDNIQALKGDCEDQSNVGIIIQGSDLTFSKATIAYEISLEETLWSGSMEIDWNVGGALTTLSWGGYDWASVKAGKILRLYYEKVTPGSWGCASLRHGAGWGNLPDNLGSQYDFPEDSGVWEIALTQAAIDDLADNSQGLIITGTNFILKKVTLE